MAKREKASKPNQICSDCACATWQWKHEHIDLQGKPICLTCPYAEWWIIRGTVNNECAHYIKGEPKNKEKPKKMKK